MSFCFLNHLRVKKYSGFHSEDLLEINQKNITDEIELQYSIDALSV